MNCAPSEPQHDKTDAQADLSLRWVHVIFWCCHAVAHISFNQAIGENVLNYGNFCVTNWGMEANLV